MTKTEHGNDSEETDDSTHSEEEGKESPIKERDSPKASPPATKVKGWRWAKLFLVAGCMGFVAFAVGYSLPTQGANSLSAADHSKDLDARIKDYINLWRNSYRNQNAETWSTIAGQLSDFASVGNMSPLVIVMAYDEAYKTTQILASEISRAALQLIYDPDTCGDTDAAKLHGSDSKINRNYLLGSYLPQIEKCRKMILLNLEKLDGNAAKDLHSMLDSDHPNIPNVVYIFTVKITKTDENVYGAVRRVLTSKWSETMGDNSVNALLSRLVNNVAINSEPEFES